MTPQRSSSLWRSLLDTQKAIIISIYQLITCILPAQCLVASFGQSLYFILLFHSHFYLFSIDNKQLLSGEKRPTADDAVRQLSTILGKTALRNCCVCVCVFWFNYNCCVTLVVSFLLTLTTVLLVLLLLQQVASILRSSCASLPN